MLLEYHIKNGKSAGQKYIFQVGQTTLSTRILEMADFFELISRTPHAAFPSMPNSKFTTLQVHHTWIDATHVVSRAAVSAADAGRMTYANCLDGRDDTSRVRR